jgi:hypothetical protein
MPPVEVTLQVHGRQPVSDVDAVLVNDANANDG